MALFDAPPLVKAVDEFITPTTPEPVANPWDSDPIDPSEVAPIQREEAAVPAPMAGPWEADALAEPGESFPLLAVTPREVVSGPWEQDEVVEPAREEVKLESSPSPVEGKDRPVVQEGEMAPPDPDSPPVSGYLPTMKKRGAELMKNLAGGLRAEEARKWWEEVEQDINLVPMGTKEAAADAWERGEYGEALNQISGATGDLIAGTATDMIAMLGGPAYVTSLWNERASNRAKSKGLGSYGKQELAETFVPTILEVGLNFAGAGRTLGAGKLAAGEAMDTSLGGIAKTTGKAGLEGAKIEGLTETTQQGLQDVTERIGTPEELGIGEFVGRAGAAGAAGAALGFIGGSASSMYAQNQQLRKEIRESEQLETVRKVEEVRERLKTGQVDAELLGDLGNPEAENFVGVATNEMELDRLRSLDAWTIGEMEKLGAEREPLVRGKSGTPAPVSADEQTANLVRYGGTDIPADVHLHSTEKYLQAIGLPIKDTTDGIYTPPGSEFIQELREARQILVELRETFAPDMSIAMMQMDDTSEKNIATTRLYPTKEGPLQVVEIDFAVVERQAKDMGVSTRTALVNTLAHEFGHNLLKTHYRIMPRGAKIALLNDYRRWLRRPGKKRDVDFWRERLSNLGPDSEAAIRVMNVGAGDANWDYWGSMQEFMAEQVSRYVTRALASKTGIISRPAADSYAEGSSILESVSQEMKDKYTELGKLYPSFKKEFPAVNLWLDSLRYKAHIRRLESWKTGDFLTESMETAEVGEKSAPEKMLGGLGKKLDLPQATSKKLEGIGRQTARFNKFMKFALTLPQLERENAHIPGVTNFVEGVRQWWREKSFWSDMANETLRAGRQLKVINRKQELKAFEKFVFALTHESEALGRRLKPEELADLARRTGISENGLALYSRMDKNFTMALNKLEAVLLKDAARKLWLKDSLALQKRQAELKADFQKLRNRNYYPLARFGKYSVSVKDPETGSVGYFALWESQRDSINDAERLKKEFPDMEVHAREVSDEMRSAVDLPQHMLDQMEELAVEEFLAFLPPDLDPQVMADKAAEFRKNIEKDFAVAQLEVSPGQKFLKRMKKRKMTPGFSEDAVRAYAAYMQGFGNFIARMEHAHTMLDGLDRIGTYTGYRSGQGQMPFSEVQKLDELKASLQDHYQYLMNPGNEWAGLRSLGAHWFLGFSPRAALVNFVQVPTASYAWLGARYGDGKAVKELAKGMRDLRSAWGRGRDGAIESDLGEALDKGMQEGFLNESLATEVGIAAEGGNLRRALPGWVPAGKGVNHGISQYMHYSMFMFQSVERVNRLITFQAAYRLARDQELEARGRKDLDEVFDRDGNDVYEEIQDRAYKIGREAIETTQGEYARWARPRGMQGKKSAAFLFKLYLQHMMYFIARDPGRKKFLAAQLGVAGLMGIPFMTDALDLAEGIIKLFPGDTNKKPDLKRVVREHVNELAEVLDVAPDLLLHGTGRYGFGALYPFDLSGSLGLDRMAPGADLLGRETGRGDNQYEQFGRIAEAAGGPLASVMFNMMRAGSADQLNEWKQAELAMPKYLAALSKAGRWAVQGEEQGYRGEALAEFDVHDPYQLAEIVGAAAGAQPRRLTEVRERRWAAKEAERFYQARAQALRWQWWEAKESGDREALKDVREATRQFNKEVPYPPLRITGASIVRSIVQRKKQQARSEAGLPDSNKMIRLYKDVADSFEGATEDAP